MMNYPVFFEQEIINRRTYFEYCQGTIPGIKEISHGTNFSKIKFKVYSEN